MSVDLGRIWEEPRLPGDVVAIVMVPHLLLKGVLPGPTGAPTEALGGKGVYGKESACSHRGRPSPLCTDTKVGSMWLPGQHCNRIHAFVRLDYIVWDQC